MQLPGIGIVDISNGGVFVSASCHLCLLVSFVVICCIFCRFIIVCTFIYENQLRTE